MLRDYVDRLVACGMTEKESMKICGLYSVGGDYSGLEKFVHVNESVFNEQKKFAMEDK